MSESSIIIKRRRGGPAADGHHGGAWKVAYADFVTAMMAFFLLMWLLNATTEEQRKGLADYFDPSIPISPISGGGTDMLSGETVYAADTLSHNNHGGEAEDELADAELASQLAEALESAVQADQVRVTLSDEGIVVELLEANGSPLFDLGNAAPSSLLTTAVGEMVPVLLASERPLKIVGHTDSIPFHAGSTYTNWELSADRANAARRLAVGAGLPRGQIAEVVGKADRMPLVADSLSPQNRRISFIIKKSS